MAPWWLRSSEDELGLGGLDQPTQVDLDDDEDAAAFAIAWDPDDDGADGDGAGPDSASSGKGLPDETVKPARRRRRRRRRKRSRKDDAASAKNAASQPGGRERSRKDDAGDRREVGAQELRSGKPAKRGSKKKKEVSKGRRADAGHSTGPRRGVPPSRSEPLSFQTMSPELLLELSERAGHDERKIAMFCDFENIALGVRDTPGERQFDINLVLARLLEKGKIIVKKAYADWERYSDYKRPFHEAAIELIDIPQKYYSGKNSADIKMVVDAMDLCYSKEHLDTFVIISGDSDFSPLVSKLKENNKYVIGVGVKSSSSSLLIGNCDEFVYYEDLWRDLQRAPRLDHLPKKQAEAFGLMVDAILALIRENKTILWGSMIKQTMKRKRPSFNEGYFDYDSFTDLLKDAETQGIIQLRRDEHSGNFAVTGFGRRAD